MNPRSQQMRLMDSTETQDSYTQYARSRASQPAFQEAYFRKTNLQDVYLWEADFQDEYLRKANFQDAYLWEVNLQNTYLSEANFRGAYLGKANFQDAYLWDVNLQNTYLGSADFQGADLWRANFQNAYLGRANFQGAVLTGVNLQGAILLAADLTMVIDLDVSQLEGEKAPYLCAAKLPDGVAVDPNRDCDKLPQILVEKYPFWYQTLTEAQAHVNRVRQGRKS